MRSTKEGSSHTGGSTTRSLAIAALGVVYGDIGTSPLYAVKECFAGEQGAALTIHNILGVISLIFWSLTMVVVVKYLTFVMQADHDGEGGILALLALATQGRPPAKGWGWVTVLAVLGLFGAALLYGDGVITPAIFVLSAVEGLAVATNVLDPYVVPITVLILVTLFGVQRRGTGGLGKIFGVAISPTIPGWHLGARRCSCSCRAMPTQWQTFSVFQSIESWNWECKSSFDRVVGYGLPGLSSN